MKRVLTIVCILLFAVSLSAQVARPSIRTNWYETVQWILNGEETLNYKTLAAPSFTGSLTLANYAYFSNSDSGSVELVFVEDGTSLGNFYIKSIKDSSLVADDDSLSIVFQSYDDSLKAPNWAKIKVNIDDVSNRSPDASILFYTITDSVQTLSLTLTGDDATIAGDLTVSGALSVTGAIAGSDGVTIGASKAITGTTAMTIGDGTQTVAINSSDWDISATGDMTGIGSITSDGAILTTSSATASSYANSAYGATLATYTDSLSAANATGIVYTSTFTFTNMGVDITDSGANGGHGSLKIADFPEGYIKILGATLDLTSATGGGGGVVDAATYDIALGSTATAVDNAALAGTEQDILTLIEGDMTGGAATLGSYDATDLALDGHATAADAYLNIAIEADDCGANDFIRFTGTVKITWILLGDS